MNADPFKHFNASSAILKNRSQLCVCVCVCHCVCVCVCDREREREHTRIYATACFCFAMFAYKFCYVGGSWGGGGVITFDLHK